jgi:hypothetical protein
MRGNQERRKDEHEQLVAVEVEAEKDAKGLPKIDRRLLQQVKAERNLTEVNHRAGAENPLGKKALSRRATENDGSG